MKALQRKRRSRVLHHTQRRRKVTKTATDAMARLLGNGPIPTAPQPYPKEGNQYFDLVCEEIRTFESGRWCVGGHPV